MILYSFWINVFMYYFQSAFPVMILKWTFSIFFQKSVLTNLIQEIEPLDVSLIQKDVLPTTVDRWKGLFQACWVYFHPIGFKSLSRHYGNLSPSCWFLLWWLGMIIFYMICAHCSTCFYTPVGCQEGENFSRGYKSLCLLW